jgi:hypothetical protein
MVGFPLLLIPLAIYNIVVWLMPSVSLTEPLVRVTLPSGAEWPITLSEVLLSLGILLLLLEIAKGAKPGSKYITDHLLSFIVFAGSVAEFVLWPKFGTSTFFLLALMTMVDFFGGIVLRAGRPPVSTSVARRAPLRTEEPVPEPRIEPVPAASAHSTASAASVAHSVLSDRPTPKAAQDFEAKASETKVSETKGSETKGTETTQSTAEPSPELQPGAAPAASPEAPQR